MKLLVFAHTPPPHHGQSNMVKLMLEGFGGDRRKAGAAPNTSPYGLDCYHVNARVSKRLADIGEVRPSKLLLLLYYCAQAIWCRFRYGVTTMYYIPAPGKYSALYRDWLALAICRLAFNKIVLHWHAAGLGKWLETQTPLWARRLTFKTIGEVDLSIILSDFNRQDAEKEYPKRILVVNNGLPDPCRDFESALLPRRLARLAARRKLIAGETLTTAERDATGGDPEVYHILYLAHCTREKGLFAALDGVLAAEKQLRQSGSPMRLKFTVAGQFMAERDRTEFFRLVEEAAAQETVSCAGYISSETKDTLLRQADLFCFPTVFPYENQPANLIEAFAYGLPVVTNRWRSIPELLPAGYPGIVEPGDVAALKSALLCFMPRDEFVLLRGLFCQRHGLDSHLKSLSDAIKSVADPAATPDTDPATLRPASARG